MELKFVHTPPEWQPQPRGVKRKNGRPRTEESKRRRSNPREKPTKLTTRKPVATSINADIWDTIFSQCHPKTLFTLRKVCWQFEDILMRNHTSIWTRSRINTYGEDCPQPPEGLTEWQYLDLIEGQGCMSCKAPRTKKAYWLWSRRWCDICLKEKTLTTLDLQDIALKYPALLGSIKHAEGDAFSRYSRIAHHQFVPVAQRMFAWWRPPPGSLYLKSDVTKTLTEYEEFLSTIADQTAEEKRASKEAWYQAKDVVATEAMGSVRTIEEFFHWKKVEEQKQQVSNRTLRVEFFRGKAKEMNPPLNDDVMQIIDDYKKAIQINSKPTDRVWETLKPKLEKCRGAAEKQIEELLVAKELTRRADYPKIELQRSNHPSEGQRILKRLAQDELRNFARTVSRYRPEDVILVVLQTVWNTYDAIPPINRPKAEGDDLSAPDGSYRPCLDDARGIYEEIIRPWMSDKMSPNDLQLGTKFKCPGCPRHDYNRKWPFHKIFYHLREKHAKELNSPWKDYEKLAVEFGLPSEKVFPWPVIEWPRNLPILATYQKATGHWDPNYEMTVSQKVDVEGDEAVRIGSAFNNRSAKKADNELMRKQRYAGPVLEAASQLEGVTLAPSLKALIIWRYACERNLSWSGDTDPTFDELQELGIELHRDGQCTILDGLLCKTCIEQKSGKPSKYGVKPHSFHHLARHFRHEHSRGLNQCGWTTRMLALPSGEDLAAALNEEGMETARDAFNGLFPRDGITVHQLVDQVTKETEDVQML